MLIGHFIYTKYKLQLISFIQEKINKLFRLSETERFNANALCKNSFSTPFSKAVYQSSFITPSFVIASTFVTTTSYTSTLAKYIIGSLNGIEANNENLFASGIK